MYDLGPESFEMLIYIDGVGCGAGVIHALIEFVLKIADLRERILLNLFGIWEDNDLLRKIRGSRAFLQHMRIREINDLRFQRSCDDNGNEKHQDGLDSHLVYY